MTRPTDPEKLAALRARQAANSRAYRERKRREREARNEPPKPRQPPSSEDAVRRAHEARAAALHRRNEVVSNLPSARNPRVNIYTPREVPTAPAAMPDTPAKRRQRIKVIRENTQASKLQNVGRNRKAEIARTMVDDPRAEEIRKNLDAGQLARFQAALSKITSVSQQTLGIYLRYEGGEGDFQSALTQLAYPKEQDPEDALGRVETLAERIERAEGLYGPAALRGSEVGGRTGRLNI